MSNTDTAHLHNEIIIPEIEIDRRIAEMAVEFRDKYPVSPLFVGPLNGCVPFAAHFMNELSRLDPAYNPQLEYMDVTTYGDSQVAQEPKIERDLDTPVYDREVWVLDDIADTGKTHSGISDHLYTRGAASVRTGVLVEREITPTHADMVAFKIAETRWLVGKGMNAPKTGPGGGRWLRYVAISKVQPENLSH